MQPYQVAVKRACSQRTNDKIIRNHVEWLKERSLAGKSGKSWTARWSRPEGKQLPDGSWEFTSTIRYERGGRKVSPVVQAKQWDQILERLATAGQHTKFNKYPWTVLTPGLPEAKVKGEPAAKGGVPAIIVKPDSKDAKDYYDKINTEPGDHFAQFYNREHQIKLVTSAIVAAKESDFQNRYNVVLHGPPGCGKTDLMRHFGKMLGEENEAYMHMDATSTTAAGVAKILLESDYIPPVLFIEEIEKADVNSLPWLLGVADIRGEIRRTNFRIGNMARNVKMLCIASVNNMKLFESVMSGALASRFPTQVYCPRPDRDTLARILEREVAKVKGRREWIEPALKFCFDEKKWTDPRKVIPVCLCGRDSLLDGTYQESLEATQRPEKDE
jgi:hypothetical protein